MLKCLHGLTQNQNESFNAMIWDRLPKFKYVSFTPLQFGVYDLVTNFNIGRKASVLIFEKLGMIPRKYIVTRCQKLNEKRLSASSYKNLDSTDGAFTYYVITFSQNLDPPPPFIIKHHHYVTTSLNNIMSTSCEPPFPIRKCIGKFRLFSFH